MHRRNRVIGAAEDCDMPTLYFVMDDRRKSLVLATSSPILKQQYVGRQ